MQIIKFVKTLAIGSIFFSMLLSISLVDNDKNIIEQNTHKAYSIVKLIKIELQDTILRASTKVADCKIIKKKEEQKITTTYARPKKAQKPKSHIEFSIFNPPKFS